MEDEQEREETLVHIQTRVQAREGNVIQVNPKYTNSSLNHNHLWLDKTAVRMCGWIYCKQTLNLIFTVLFQALANCINLVLLHLFSTASLG